MFQSKIHPFPVKSRDKAFPRRIPLLYKSIPNPQFERLREMPEYQSICRKVTRREYDAVVDYALELGVRNAFVQEGDTARESFIPAFDGEGTDF